MSNGFLQDTSGDYSNSRLVADIMIISALLMVFLFIAVGVFKPEVDLMKIATAIGVLFGAVAGTAMTFLFFQKKEEGSQAKDAGIAKKDELITA